MVEIGFGIALFTLIVTLLALLVQIARAALVPDAPVSVDLGNARTVQGRAGHSLLEILNDAGVMLPSSCAGRGSCGLCRVTVFDGAGPAGPVEDSRLGRSELAAGVRLACQMRVRHDLKVAVPDDAFGIRRLRCALESTRSLSPLVKEVVLRLPEGETMTPRPGNFVQLTAPPHALRFRNIEIDGGMSERWDALGLWDLESGCEAPTSRAYSLANTPEETEDGVLVLFIRLALPPPGAAEAVPPGTVSSWLFSLSPGAGVDVLGPYGQFLPSEGEREMVYIGGGVGMAPIRSHIFDLLTRQKVRRTISFWYGARSKIDLFCEQQFEKLAAEYENFSWNAALSEPRSDDGWSGPVGFIHEVVYERYLAEHPAPEECEYYLCGPPLMVRAVLNMLDGLGVDPERIAHDDFGSAGV